TRPAATHPVPHLRPEPEPGRSRSVDHDEPPRVAGAAPVAPGHHRAVRYRDAAGGAAGDPRRDPGRGAAALRMGRPGAAHVVDRTGRAHLLARDPRADRVLLPAGLG